MKNFSLVLCFLSTFCIAQTKELYVYYPHRTWSDHVNDSVPRLKIMANPYYIIVAKGAYVNFKLTSNKIIKGFITDYTTDILTISDTISGQKTEIKNNELMALKNCHYLGRDGWPYIFIKLYCKYYPLKNVHSKMIYRVRDNKGDWVWR